LFEKNSKAGKKIQITGNGKCNITNKNISPKNYNLESQEFIKYTLDNFNFKKSQEFFGNLGVEFVAKNNLRVYPKSLQASSVVDLLFYEAVQNGVEFIFDMSIQNPRYKNDKFLIDYQNQTKYFDKLIIATGSKAMPSLGGCDIGYAIASNFGHNIIKPFASLVQLKSDLKSIKNLAGVRIKSKVSLQINGKNIQNSNGDVLFTSYGLSGNAILDISRYASYYLNNSKNKIIVIIDIFPDDTKDKLVDILTKRLKLSKNKDKYFWLIGFVHKKLINFLIDSCGINKNKVKANELNQKDIISLAYFMKNLKINIVDTNGFKTAEVCAGGVDTKEINSTTMESKLQKNLYFIGEVLDIDGQCGGYNLHFAFGSGYVCASAIK
jgi:predicted Rossmann fold flavoprotein